MGSPSLTGHLEKKINEIICGSVFFGALFCCNLALMIWRSVPARFKFVITFCIERENCASETFIFANKKPLVDASLP